MLVQVDHHFEPSDADRQHLVPLLAACGQGLFRTDGQLASLFGRGVGAVGGLGHLEVAARNGGIGQFLAGGSAVRQRELHAPLRRLDVAQQLQQRLDALSVVQVHLLTLHGRPVRPVEGDVLVVVRPGDDLGGDVRRPGLVSLVGSLLATSHHLRDADVVTVVAQHVHQLARRSAATGRGSLLEVDAVVGGRGVPIRVFPAHHNGAAVQVVGVPGRAVALQDDVRFRNIDRVVDLVSGNDVLPVRGEYGRFGRYGRGRNLVSGGIVAVQLRHHRQPVVGLVDVNLREREVRDFLIHGDVHAGDAAKQRYGKFLLRCRWDEVLVGLAPHDETSGVARVEFVGYLLREFRLQVVVGLQAPRPPLVGVVPVGDVGQHDARERLGGEGALYGEARLERVRFVVIGLGGQLAALGHGMQCHPVLPEEQHEHVVDAGFVPDGQRTADAPGLGRPEQDLDPHGVPRRGTVRHRIFAVAHARNRENAQDGDQPSQCAFAFGIFLNVYHLVLC